MIVEHYIYADAADCNGPAEGMHALDVTLSEKVAEYVRAWHEGNRILEILEDFKVERTFVDEYIDMTDADGIRLIISDQFAALETYEVKEFGLV